MAGRTLRWHDRAAIWSLIFITGLLVGHSLLRPPEAAAPARVVRIQSPAMPALPPPSRLSVALPSKAGDSIPDVAAAVLPSVVNIYSTSAIGEGGGSGVIVHADGVILTNNHVVEAARDLVVRLHDGREYPAKAVGRDPKSDLAVVKVVGKLPTDLVVARFGNSDALRIGETVLAVGNPFGLSGTVTMGIVSALGRSNQGIFEDANAYEDFIQTDAAINPGNSGGALVNTSGEVIGINTAILSRTGGNQGIGFAIPSALAHPIMVSLLETGKVERGWLGVYIGDLTPAMAEQEKLRMPEGTLGVLVNSVIQGGPGEAGGLQAGDVIVGVDGKRTETSSRLRNTVSLMPAGQTAQIDLYRQGEFLRVDVVLGELPEEVP